MKYFEFTGKTAEEAIELGLQELQVAREEVEITVLEEGKKKLFGSVKAKVRIGVNETEENVPAQAVVESSTNETDGARAVEFLKGLFDVLKINAEVTLVNEAEKIEINVNAQNTTKIIGKHGEMLKKISTLARQDIERFMGTKVYMETWIKVKEKWRENANYIRSFGYDDK